jgi:hypothetical protein
MWTTVLVSGITLGSFYTLVALGFAWPMANCLFLPAMWPTGSGKLTGSPSSLPFPQQS